MKTCVKCHQPKELTEFFKDAKMPGGRRNDCKACKQKSTYQWREKNKDRYNAMAAKWRKNNPEKEYGHEIKRRYGCTLEMYNAMLIAQEGACAICKKLHNPAVSRGRLFVDHCHATGAIRALLCSACNKLLGYSNDDARVLLEAVAYLARHKRHS